VLRQLLPAAVAACLLIVVPATSAQAAPVTAKVAGAAAAREPRLATMTQQAARYWNDGLARCSDGVQVLLGDASTAPTPDAWAWAEVGGCSLWINTSNHDAWPLKDSNLLPWCNVIAHEYGHLRGLEHVADAKNIMNAIVPMASAECGGWDESVTSTGSSPQGTESSAGRPAATRKTTTRKRCARSTSRRAKRAGRTCKAAARAKKTTGRKRSRTARTSVATAS
jgi:hypothetical protein